MNVVAFFHLKLSSYSGTVSTNDELVSKNLMLKQFLYLAESILEICEFFFSILSKQLLLSANNSWFKNCLLSSLKAFSCGSLLSLRTWRELASVEVSRDRASPRRLIFDIFLHSSLPVHGRYFVHGFFFYFSQNLSFSFLNLQYLRREFYLICQNSFFLDSGALSNLHFIFFLALLKMSDPSH